MRSATLTAHHCSGCHDEGSSGHATRRADEDNQESTMTPANKVAASELPESIRARLQALSAASDPLAIEGEDTRIVGYIVSPEQLQRLLEDAYTEQLLDDAHAVVQEARAERAAESAQSEESRE
jgi:hypothetical protein